MDRGVVMYPLVREAKSLQQYADRSDLKPEPIISTNEVNQRTNELLDTIPTPTNIFENRQDQRSHVDI